MENNLAKTKTKLMVLLVVVAIVAIVATVALSAVISADADPTVITINSSYALTDNVAHLNGSDEVILQLGTDIRLTNTLVIPASVTLDLNGHTLSYNGDGADPVIEVSVGAGTFTLTDSNHTTNTRVIDSRAGSFTVTGGVITGGTNSGVYVSSGNFAFVRGTIAGNITSNATRGGGVTFTASASNFVMQDGAVISNNTAINGGGVYVLSKGSGALTIYGGAVTNNIANFDGGGIYLTGTRGEIFTMYDGDISYNAAQYGHGGGIFVSFDNTALINGGKITNNTSPLGGGVYVDNGAVTMTAGEISHNETSSDGAGVYLNNGSLTLSGDSATITANKANYGNGAGVYVSNGTSSELTINAGAIDNNEITTYGNGAGVYVSSGAFTMNGGSVSNNRILNNGTGGGVYVASGSVKMQGKVVIDNNTLSTNAGNNLYLADSTTLITITGEIDEYARIGVTVDFTRTFTSGYKTAARNTTAKGFFSDNSEWGTALTSTAATAELMFTARLVLQVNDTYYGDFATGWAAALADKGATVNVKLLADVELSAVLAAVQVANFTLDLNGYMLRCTATAGNFITIQPVNGAMNINFTLKDSRPEANPHQVLDKSSNKYVQIYGGVLAGAANGIYINDGTANTTVNFAFQSGTIAGCATYGMSFLGTSANGGFTMRSGATVRYNGSHGIHLAGKQTMIMYGGDVSYNGGHGINVSTANNRFTMHDGRINHNKSSGIYSNIGPVVVNDGDVSYNGTGITLAGDAVKGTVHGGTVTHNSANGIYLNNANVNSLLTVDGGEVSYNATNGIYTIGKAIVTGANTKISYNGQNGVHSQAAATNLPLTLADCTINNNGTANGAATATNGVYSITLTYLTNCTISNNVGNGVYFNNANVTADTEMKGGTISGNGKAGVYLANNAKFMLTSGDILRNSGSGVYVVWGVFTMNGGSISYNSGINGGGVSFSATGANTSTFTMTNGEISYNTATNGGGVYLGGTNATSAVTFNLQNSGKIHHNTATAKGGGVYVNVNRTTGTTALTLNMTSGEISDNKAQIGGGVALDVTSTDLTYAGTGFPTLTMTAGKIVNNTATVAGGVYDGMYAVVNLSGTPIVQDNHDDDDNNSNLYLVNNNVLTITASLSGGASVYLSFEQLADARTITSGFYSKGNTVNDYFFLDDDSHVEIYLYNNAELRLQLKSSTGTIKLTPKAGSVAYYSNLSTALAASTSEEDVVQLLDDIGTTQITITKSVTLDLNGHMIKFSSVAQTAHLLFINTPGITVTITDSTMEGGKVPTSIHYVSDPRTSNGAPVAVKGGVIYGRVTVGPGANNSTTILNFKAGSIAGCSGQGTAFQTGADTSTWRGYGIEQERGTINMYDDANICYNYFGIQQLGGIFNMYGGKIYGQSDVEANARGYAYGSMAVSANGTFNMSGGEIFNNERTYDPPSETNIVQTSMQGAICAVGIAQTFTPATNNKAAVYTLYSTGVWTMSGGSIHDNTVYSYKRESGSNGAMSVGWTAKAATRNWTASATFKMTGGEIVNNNTIMRHNNTTLATPDAHGNYGFITAGISVHFTNNNTYGSGSGILQLEGNPVITGNMVTLLNGNQYESNLYLRSSAVINVTGLLLEGANVGVTVQNNARNITTNYNTYLNDGTNNPFYSDNVSRCVTYNGAGNIQIQLHTAATLTEVPMEPATCQSTGHARYWECSDCGRKFTSITANNYVEFKEDKDSYTGGHVVEKWTKVDEFTHAGVCTVCSETVSSAEHSTGIWSHVDGTAKHSSYCSVCNSDVERDCDYDGNYRFSDAQHWEQCKLCGAEYTRGDHEVKTWSPNGISEHIGTCTICGKTNVTHAHNWGTWQHDSEQHWQVCDDCGYNSIHVDHVVNNWEETEPGSGQYTGSCDYCGQPVTEGHRWSEDWTTEGNYHWRACYDCDAKYMYGEHEMDWGNAARTRDEHNGTCTICHTTISGDCTYTQGYGHDESQHWLWCDVCKQAKVGSGNKEDHRWVLTRIGETGMHANVCSVCGYEDSDSRTAHVFSIPRISSTDHWSQCECGAETVPEHHSLSYVTTDITKHWQACSGCSYTTDPEQHHMELSANETGHAFSCDVCGLAEENAPHVYEQDKYVTNGLYHWQVCTECGWGEEARVAHSWDNATAASNGDHATHTVTCSVCGESHSVDCTYDPNYVITATDHSSVCTICGDAVTTAHSFAMTRGDNTQHWQACSVCYYVNESSKQDHDFSGNSDTCHVCGRPTLDELAEQRRNAIAHMTSAAEAAVAGLVGPNAASYVDSIAELRTRYENAVNSAATAEEITAAEEAFIASVNSIVLNDKKENAVAKLEEVAAAEKANLPADLSEEDRARYEAAIDAAYEAAIASVNAASSADEVTSEYAKGEENIKQAILGVKKEIAKEELQKEAQAKKDEIDQRVADPNDPLTEEEGERLKDVIDRETQRGEDKIDDAKDVDGIEDAKDRAGNILDDTAKATDPDLAEKKADARDELDDKANQAKDDIDKRDDLTPAQKEELKGKVEQDNNKAQDNVTKAETPEAVDQAVTNGKNNMDNTATSNPNTGSDLLAWFKNNALPLGYAAIALGGMLFLIIILAIAARKPKKNK